MNSRFNKITFGAIFLFAMLFSTSTIMANTLKINLGYWPGELDPELEERFFLDDIIIGSSSSYSLGRIDLPWENKDTNTIYPLGLSYITQAGPGDLVLAANYMQYNPEYSFVGLSAASALATSISFVDMLDYEINDTEGEIGYRFHIVENKFYITPKAGYRKHNKSFKKDELILGSGTIIKTLDSNFEAQSSGLYFGVDLQFYLTKEFSLVASYIGASSNWSGSAINDQIAAGAAGSTTFFTYENASSGYQLSINRWSLGVQYDLGKDWHFQAGVREETLKQSYPDYINLAFNSVTGFGIATNEVLTDYIFYGQEINQTKGFVYVSATYDIDL